MGKPTRTKQEFKVTYFLWRSRKNKDGRSPLYIRSKQNSDKQYIRYTGVHLFDYQWDFKKREPKSKNSYLLLLESKLEEAYKRLQTHAYNPTLKDLWDVIDWEENIDERTLV